MQMAAARDVSSILLEGPKTEDLMKTLDQQIERQLSNISESTQNLET